MNLHCTAMFWLPIFTNGMTICDVSNGRFPCLKCMGECKPPSFPTNIVQTQQIIPSEWVNKLGSLHGSLGWIWINTKGNAGGRNMEKRLSTSITRPRNLNAKSHQCCRKVTFGWTCEDVPSSQYQVPAKFNGHNVVWQPFLHYQTYRCFGMFRTLWVLQICPGSLVSIGLIWFPHVSAFNEDF